MTDMKVYTPEQVLKELPTWLVISTLLAGGDFMHGFEINRHSLLNRKNNLLVNFGFGRAAYDAAQAAATFLNQQTRW